MHRHSRMIASAIASLTAVTLLAACGSGATSSASSSSSPKASTSANSGGASSGGASSGGAATGGAIDIGVGTVTPQKMDHIAYFLQASKTQSYTVAQAQGAQKAADEAGITIDIFYSNLDPALELSSFQQAISSGKYGGILIQPVTNQLCKTLGDQALKYQVLVMVVGNSLCGTGSETGDALWSPGSITYMGGQNGVDGILGLLAEATRLSPGPQKVMLALGTQTHPSDVAWEVALKQYQQTHPELELVSTVYTDFTAPTAFTNVQNALQGNKQVTMIFSPYIDITSGVVKAVQASGLKDQISIYENGGGSKTATELVKSGALKGDLPAYPNSLGYEGVKVLIAAGEGTQPPKFIPADGNTSVSESLAVISADNVGSFTPQW